ncbi:hypothetical protein F511_30521 [Dorcoceras hygrometricum]|uniref:Uncharacterized protein n=1 Tax=Dorcoceras hygrometricum TaxID=472368 RepID=A0A2Z7CXJ2_9LAMI|nr:hypothetical protein F511_30521 [Dorcoceras hygrometricum]
MSKKIEKMKVKKKLVKANHVECHQKFQARIHEAEDSMQAQHLLIEALVDEKDSLLQTIHDLQEANNAPAPFDGDWEEEPEEELEDLTKCEPEDDSKVMSVKINTCVLRVCELFRDNLDRVNARAGTAEDFQDARNIKLVHQLGTRAVQRSSAEKRFGEKQNSSSADQVQRTVFKCRRIDKCSDQVQRRRQESVIVKNVDAYDDVKITCRPIPKELWSKIPVVKEVTSWGTSSAQQYLRVMNKPARCRETSWLSSNEPGKKSSGQEQIIRSTQEHMRREEESFEQLEVKTSLAQTRTEISW